MGMCHMNRNTNRGSGNDSCDTASTDRDCKHYPDAVTLTDSVKQGLTDAITSTTFKESSIDLKNKGNQVTAQASVGQISPCVADCEASNQSVVGEIWPPTAFQVKTPSLLNESVMDRWNSPEFSPGELFHKINFDRLFIKQ